MTTIKLGSCACKCTHSYLIDAVIFCPLHAAAPEMKKFIDSITDVLGPYPDLNNHQIVADAYAIIKKSEGR